MISFTYFGKNKPQDQRASQKLWGGWLRMKKRLENKGVAKGILEEMIKLFCILVVVVTA